MDRYDWRTQYHVPAKDICERTDSGRFPCREARRSTTRYIGDRNPTRAMDRSSCVDGSGAGLILTSLEGTEFTYALRFQFTASNNEAEYEALVLVEVLKEKSIREEEVATVVEEEGPTWMTSIMEYLKDRTLPSDRKEANKLRGLCGWKIHEGRAVCTQDHGSWWLRNPQQSLTPITAPWPFYKWGIDIAGPFPEGPGKVEFLIVAMDYFTKWIEAKAVVTITGNQSNGLVERANRSLGEGIKARLGEVNKNWIEELPHLLWGHRTMIKSSHSDTPFSLTYGTEAVIPTEIECQRTASW
ncbi:reverse transcriptase domain-containing protein [Tanacetum coccineum]